MILGYEQRQSLLRQTTTTEAVIKGASAQFLIVDTGGATAVTRGPNGRIPSRPNNYTPVPIPLEELHDKTEMTNFDIFKGQGDQRKAMQEQGMGVINRTIDQQILAELATATNDTGAAAPASVNLVTKGLAILGNQKVNVTDGNVFGIMSPGFYAGMLGQAAFASRDYTNNMPFDGQGTMFKWANVNWIVHNDLPNLATDQEQMYLYHKSAIGHAMDTKGIQTEIGYNGEDDYSWARHTFFGAAKLLQNAGVVVLNHTGSTYAAQ